ncbi:uncharacterized protein PHACADRAFT_263175 [Phanerochaete carnosa HHB-10118-sp]|uniref:Uncharacterized protein n=1 Tax=Phanerochaete carnosa (strain HHB-10118-sp) TaxID=650164 RepID=K5VX35_PHACS|nr:uncharacterized protein PHACADRAFT_263175 [Phanerochaete carnosa HHB-10118-sp]EKM51169.1 hypothetical protein PHACADRAFT_263175 [Phanerochaete carnosa HHB-10118-sp]
MTWTRAANTACGWSNTIKIGQCHRKRLIPSEPSKAQALDQTQPVTPRVLPPRAASPNPPFLFT